MPDPCETKQEDYRQKIIKVQVMKEELTTKMHAEFLEEDGWTRLDVQVLNTYANILKGINKRKACKNNGITVEQYDNNIERVKRL